MNKRLPICFFVLNSLVLAVICSLLCIRYYSATADEVNLTFTELFSLGHFFIISFGLTVILVIVPNFFKLRKTVIFTVFFINGLILSLLLTDTFVYDQFRIHLNIAMLQMTLLGGGQIVKFSSVMILEIVVLVLLCFSVGGLCIWFANKLPCRTSTLAALLFTMVGIIAGTNLWYGYSSAKHYSEFTAIDELIPLAFPLRFNRFLIKYGLVDANEIYGLNLSINTSKQGMLYPLHPLRFESGTNYNIVFLYVDALRADMLNPENMPKTWEFSKSATRFNDHWSGGINTRHGIFSLFTGIPGSYWNKALSTNTPSVLVTALMEKGYEIGAFTGAPLTYPEFNQTIFFGVKNLRIESRGGNAIERDSFVIEDFEAWIKKLPPNKPFFSFIFLNNVHSSSFPQDEANTFYQPYWKEINHLELNNSFDREPYFNRYKNAVRFADKNIGIILDFLEQENLLSNTIVMIGSDHGEEFNDNKQNFWTHNGNFTAVQAKTPFLVYWPGKKPSVIDYRTSALDVVPTILPEVLGCTNPTSDYSSGYSLWENANRPFLYCSNYSKNAYIEPDRVVMINEKGLMDFVDNQNKKSSDRTIPLYIKDAMKEQTRFFK